MTTKILYCEVCDENKPYTEGKWGKQLGMWVCDACRQQNQPVDSDDEEEWFDDDGEEDEDD